MNLSFLLAVLILAPLASLCADELQSSRAGVQHFELPVILANPNAEFQDNARPGAMIIGMDRTPKGRIWDAGQGRAINAMAIFCSRPAMTMVRLGQSHGWRSEHAPTQRRNSAGRWWEIFGPIRKDDCGSSLTSSSAIPTIASQTGSYAAMILMLRSPFGASR